MAVNRDAAMVPISDPQKVIYNNKIATTHSLSGYKLYNICVWDDSQGYSLNCFDPTVKGFLDPKDTVVTIKFNESFNQPGITNILCNFIITEKSIIELVNKKEYKRIFIGVLNPPKEPKPSDKQNWYVLENIYESKIDTGKELSGYKLYNICNWKGCPLNCFDPTGFLDLKDIVVTIQFDKSFNQPDITGILDQFIMNHESIIELVNKNEYKRIFIGVLNPPKAPKPSDKQNWYVLEKKETDAASAFSKNKSMKKKSNKKKSMKNKSMKNKSNKKKSMKKKSNKKKSMKKL
jgi:peptidyl-tRNA hydrolase